MVRIIDYKQVQNTAGEPFISLVLQGDLVLVQSQENGRYYATAKKTSITSTFSEEEAKALIGREIPGKLEKVACEPYEITDENSGEVITLSHRWDYLPEGAPSPMRVVVNNAA